MSDSQCEVFNPCFGHCQCGDMGCPDDTNPAPPGDTMKISDYEEHSKETFSGKACSPPQTFTTPDVHHLSHSPPQTLTTSDIALLSMFDCFKYQKIKENFLRQGMCSTNWLSEEPHSLDLPQYRDIHWRNSESL